MIWILGLSGYLYYVVFAFCVGVCLDFHLVWLLLFVYLGLGMYFFCLSAGFVSLCDMFVWMIVPWVADCFV